MSTVFTALVAGQRGLVTRSQCLGEGLTRSAIDWKLASGRWQVVHPGVYLTEPGRDDWHTRALAALLACGLPSALSHESGGYVWGLVPAPGSLIEVAVPLERRVRRALDGVRVRRMAHAFERTDERGWPHRIGVEHTVLDLAEHRPLDRALALAARACQQRLTTVPRIVDAIGQRPHLAGRALLLEALGPVAEGAESVAEVRFVRDVERAHGLPRGRRQADAGGGRRRDTEYEGLGVVVEVDGRQGHEDWSGRRRDGLRDREVVASGGVTIRLFWEDVALRPCRTAAELATVLRRRGWDGLPSRCRRRACTVR